MIALYPDKEISIGTIFEVRQVRNNPETSSQWDEISCPEFYDTVNSVWTLIANAGKVECFYYPELSYPEIFDAICATDHAGIVVKVTSPEINQGIFQFKSVVKYYIIKKFEIKSYKVLINNEYQNSLINISNSNINDNNN